MRFYQMNPSALSMIGSASKESKEGTPKKTFSEQPTSMKSFATWDSAEAFRASSIPSLEILVGQVADILNKHTSNGDRI